MEEENENLLKLAQNHCWEAQKQCFSPEMRWSQSKRSSFDFLAYWTSDITQARQIIHNHFKY